MKRDVAGLGKKPVTARFLCLAILLLGAGPSAAEAWTVERGHAHLLEHGAFAELKEASAARARARGRAALPRNNPFIGYQREALFGGDAEDFLWLGGTLDLSLRRGLLEEAGARRATAAELVGDARVRDALLTFDRLFYAALSASERLDAFAAWVSRLDELARRTRAREAQGDASRYDVLRVEREIVKARQARVHAELARVAKRTELAVWLGDSPDALELQGELRPPAAPTAPATPRPLEARALYEEARARDAERDAASRWYLPPITATAGGKTLNGPGGRELGYLFTLQVPIPVLERLDARRAALAADRRVVEVEAHHETHHAATRAAAALAVWRRALGALDERRSRVTERADALVKTARAAWGGGELSLLALLEAERTTLDDKLADIALKEAARDAQLTHAALTTEGPP
jgi:cobalt-zinc-cadmium efflux system outer membrane protein